MIKQVYGLYALFDSVSESVVGVHTALTGPMYIRENLRQIVATWPLKDVTLYHVGDVDMSTMIVTPVKPEIVPWSDYKFPETKSESLAPLGSDVASKVAAFEEHTADVNKR